MIVERVHHRLWSEYEKANELNIDLPPVLGKWQYICSSEKGKISCVELLHYFHIDESTIWEIFCLEGELFEDTERFPTKDEAMKRIELLLCSNEEKVLQVKS